MTVSKPPVKTSFDDIPGQLPNGTLPDGFDLEQVAKDAVQRLPGLITEQHLAPNALWRDILSFTNHFRTFDSSTTVSKAYSLLSAVKKPTNFRYDPEITEVTQLGPQLAWVNVGFTFTTDDQHKANNSGIISLVADVASEWGWKVWLLRTWLENYEGLGHPDQLTPDADGVAASNDRQSPGEPAMYDAVIVGGGSFGLCCGGRLKALGCSYLVIDKKDNVGQVWTDRYDSLRWHLGKEYGNLPFDRTFRPEDPYFLPSKTIADGYSRWTRRFGINIATGTTVQNASWNEASRSWTIVTSGSGGESTVRARNLILAPGSISSEPRSPHWPLREKFRGTAMHSVEYRSSKPWAGKRGVVIGAANTAHDVAEDMVKAGLSSVTMIQRGKTYVFPADWASMIIDGHYNAETSVERGDRLAASYPNKITREMANLFAHHQEDVESERFDALERAGFKTERHGDLFDCLLNRFGGHCTDTGTSALIANGQIKMKGELVKEWTEAGLRFEDDSEIAADLVVLCTGFEPDFRVVARGIIGDAADRMDDFYRPDHEGEHRGAYKFAGHPGLYYGGGDLRNARWYSRFIALQVQADVQGIQYERYLHTPGVRQVAPGGVEI